MSKALVWISVVAALLSIAGSAIAVGGKSEKIEAQGNRLERMERETMTREEFRAWATGHEKRVERIERGVDMLDDKIDEVLRRSRR